MQAEPLERESVLLLAHGVVGGRSEVEGLARAVRDRGAPVFWFFRRMEAVVLTMLERWDALGEALAALDRIAGSRSPYLEALVAAIGEEAAAARGGAAPSHRRLRELGYLGWSQLLTYRPPVAASTR